MKLFIKIIFLCLFSQSVFAYCDFEIVKMESGMQSLAEKTNFIQDIDNLPELPFTFLKNKKVATTAACEKHSL